METYGYARVSSTDQNLQRQIDALHAAGIDDKHILTDQKSGKDFNRLNYNLLVGSEKNASLLRKGDCLVITSLDRLGRNYSEILDQWKYIINGIGADIRVLEMPLLNTNMVSNTLDKKFVTDLILQILSYVSDKERENIRIRQRQGIDAAKAMGKHLGRPAAQYPENWNEVYTQWQDGEILAKQAIQLANVSTTTFYKLAGQWEEEQGLSRKRYYQKSRG